MVWPIFDRACVFICFSGLLVQETIAAIQKIHASQAPLRGFSDMFAWLVPLSLASAWLGGAAMALFHPPRNDNLTGPEIEVNIDFGPRVSTPRAP